MPTESDRAAVRPVDPAFWRERSVLVTGHTGFKGAWLSLWLQSLGARVAGFSLDPPSEPSLYELVRVGEGMSESVHADIRDPQSLTQALVRAAPEIVFHLAAQPLVRRSYVEPRVTYETNVMGTVNVLDAVRRAGGVRAVVNVTSDKCYDTRESEPESERGERVYEGGDREHGDHGSGHDRRTCGYRESDPLGGHDPYSSSKAAAELLTSAYRRSFFSDPDGPRVASARAGNVIGGGDWGEDRLLPDIVRAVVAGRALRLRNPAAVRPWQHVLCPLGGYLVLAQALCESPAYAAAWNFGPDEGDARSVQWMVERVSGLWPGAVHWERDGGPHPPEADWLKLDSTRARTKLGWTPSLELDEGLAATVAWYRAWRAGQGVRDLTLEQIAGAG
jgi:CDP-glucose 4,6-dehydratase